MQFRNYCVVIMGDTLGAQDEIIKISETKPNVLDAKGVLIATFSAIAEPRELTEWFKQNNRSFLLFDLNPETSGFHINKENIHEGLFGFLKEINIDNMNHEFIKAIKLSGQTDIIKKTEKKQTNKETSSSKDDGNKLNKAEITNMKPEQREELLNYLIEQGLENLSESDKTLLHLLAE